MGASFGSCCASGNGKEECQLVFASYDNLSRLIREDFEQVFKKCDKNRDGYLNKKEMDQVLDQLRRKGVVISAKTGAKIVSQADQDRDGRVSAKEFQEWIDKECLARQQNLLNLMNHSTTGDVLWIDCITNRAFKAADKDHDGQVDTEELVTYFTEVSKQFGEEPCSSEQMAKFMKNADVNKDGTMSKSEFRRIVKQIVVKLYLHADGGSGILSDACREQQDVQEYA